MKLAEIESWNSRDNVVDLDGFSMRKRAPGKEDVTSEKTAEEKKILLTKSGSSQKSDSSKQSAGQKTGAIKRYRYIKEAG